jgi:hypothetical protein
MAPQYLSQTDGGGYKSENRGSREANSNMKSSMTTALIVMLMAGLGYEPGEYEMPVLG